MIPDKGYAWLVLLAAFLGNAIFDGIIFSFGIFYMEFLDAFQAGRSTTSWIGSVISAVYSLIGRHKTNACIVRNKTLVNTGARQFYIVPTHCIVKKKK